MASSALMPGCGCIVLHFTQFDIAALWKFLSLAQELILLAVINAPYVSSNMISLYQGCGFVNFNYFDSFLSLLPADFKGEEGYNALDDNSQYHPYIF